MKPELDLSDGKQSSRLRASQNVPQSSHKNVEEDFGEEMTPSNGSCTLDGQWYFQRVQDREDRRELSSQWYFDRVEDRQYSRTDANWYVRAMRHNAVIDNAGYRKHSSDAEAVKGSIKELK